MNREINAAIKTLTERIARPTAKYNANREEQKRIIIGQSIEFFENPSESYDKLMLENNRLQKFIISAKNAIAVLETLDEKDINI